MISKLAVAWNFFEVCILGNVSNILFGFGLLVGINEVISRYIFHHSYAWSNELLTLTLVIAVLLNYGLAQKEKRHIRVSILAVRMGKTAQKIMDIFAYCVGIILCSLIIFHGVKLTYEVMSLNYTTEVLRVPTCVGYGIFVLAFFLLLVRYISDIYRLITN